MNDPSIVNDSSILMIHPCITPGVNTQPSIASGQRPGKDEYQACMGEAAGTYPRRGLYLFICFLTHSRIVSALSRFPHTRMMSHWMSWMSHDALFVDSGLIDLILSRM